MSDTDKRLNLVLPESVYNLLLRIADYHDTNVTGAIKTAIKVEAWWIDQIKKGNQVLVLVKEDSFGKAVELKRIMELYDEIRR